MGPAKKGTNPVIPIVIVLALIAVGVAAFFLLSGSDDSGPEATAEDFFNQVSDGDCAGAFELINPASLEESNVTPEQAQQACEQASSGDTGAGLFSQQAELVSTNVTDESDSSATVDLEIEANGETNTFPLEMSNVDGDWLINFGSLGGGGPETPDPGNGGGGPGGPDDGSGGSGSGGSGSDSGPGGSDGGSGGSDGGSGGGGAAEAFPEATPREIELAEQCAAGSMAACDDLWPITPADSDIEAFAESCGGQDPGGEHVGTCEEEFG